MHGRTTPKNRSRSARTLCRAVVWLVLAAQVVADPSVFLATLRASSTVQTGSPHADNDDADAAERVARDQLDKLEASRNVNPEEVAEALDLLVETLWENEKAAEDETRELAERALRLRIELHGDGHWKTALSLTNLGQLEYRSGRYREALPFWESALAAMRTEHSQDDFALWPYLRNVANVRLYLGDYEQARPLYEQIVEIQQVQLGSEHPELASSLYNLAICSRQMGDLSRASALYESLLAISEQSEIEPRFRAIFHSGYATLNWVTGDYGVARSHFERALEIQEKTFGPDSQEVSGTLNNLGQLFRRIGDYPSARSYLERALEIRSERLDSGHPELAQSRHNLAVLLATLGEYERAATLFDQSAATWEQSGGATDPRLANTLQNHADMLVSMKQYSRAHQLYQRALAIWEERLPPDHYDIAHALIGLGLTFEQQESPAEAREVYERALAIRKTNLGETHPFVAQVLDNLARLQTEIGEYREAFERAMTSEEIFREHLSLTAETLPERQALDYASLRGPSGDLALSMAATLQDPHMAREATDALIRSRALVLDELASRRRSVARSTDPEVARLVEEHALATMRLANLLVRGPGAVQSDSYGAQLARARSDEELAAQRLAERSALHRARLADQGIGLREVLADLETDALVAFVRYDHYAIAKHHSERGNAAVNYQRRSPAPSYLAIVLRGDRNTPVFIRLGSASDLDSKIDRWVDEAAHGLLRPGRPPKAAEESLRILGREIREQIWEPLLPVIGEASRVFLVPDAALNLVSFAALPEGFGYLVESDRLLHYLSAERDLVLAKRGERTGNGLLVLGAPAFDESGVFDSSYEDAKGSEPVSTGECFSLGSHRFDQLPASETEIREVVARWQRADTGEAVEALYGARATEVAFKTQAPNKRVVHLATHGFFLDGTCSPARPGTRGFGGLASDSSRSGKRVSVANPLRLSGLAFAGANHRHSARAGEDDGILTAEEITALDLTGVEWAVLSACDTARGDIKTGEGVFGLRRSFQVAGASTVIMSLWEVEDRAGRQWMRALYDGRLGQDLSTAESVRSASLEILKWRRQSEISTHPFYWAGWIAVGDHR